MLTKSQTAQLQAGPPLPLLQLGRRLEGRLQGGQARQQLGPLLLCQADPLLPRQQLSVLLVILPSKH